MRLRFLAHAIAFAVVAMPLAAQQPKPKSQKELDALQKVQAAAQAQNWDAEIQAINYVLENFADTAYKNMLLNMAMDAAQQKGDYGQTIAFGEQAVQADPSNIPARVTMAEVIAQHTRENDLDKAQSIKKIQDNANKALDLLKAATNPPQGLNADQWPSYKAQLTSQCYDALGQAADLDKKYPDAIQSFKSSLEAMPANTVANARLAKVYVDAKQYDDAIAAADKVINSADAPAVVKQFAQQQKDNATKLKAAGAAAPPK